MIGVLNGDYKSNPGIVCHTRESIGGIDMGGTVVRLGDWISGKLESGKITDPDKIAKLYFHYHRIKLLEATIADRGPKDCPDRRIT